MSDDQAFLDALADELAGLPAVRAVSLGGSRAAGTQRPDSDWDLAIYYRGEFDPASLRALGHPGDVSDVGAWGGGVFNGGAWLRIGDRSVDVHYRDLDVVEHELAESRQGRFHVEPLMFHLAGIPSYLVVGELAIHRVLRGELPRPEYPEALRNVAGRVWRDTANLTLTYAEANHARHSRVAEVAGSIAVAGAQAAHGILASRAEWVTNEKTLLTRSGLRSLDDLIIGLGSADPEALSAAVRRARELVERASG